MDGSGYVQLSDSCNPILLTEKWIVSVFERNRLRQAMSSEYVVESTDNNFWPFKVRVNQPTTDGTLTVCMVSDTSSLLLLSDCWRFVRNIEGNNNDINGWTNMKRLITE